jgi:citrate lyase subunit gamma (acyl carrier protein)
MIVVGSLESSDCLITLKPNHGTQVLVESIVYDAFGKQIEAVILKTLKQYNVSNVFVHCQDKGALDYTIIGRMEVALMRFKEANDES